VKKLIIFLAVLLFGRINPFEPVLEPGESVKVTPKYFKKAKIYLPNDARILKKIIFVYQSVSSDIKQKSIVIDKDVDFHAPIIIIHSPKEFGGIKKNFGVLTFYAKNKTIFIKTKDRLLRKFFLIRPFRLVLDFQRYSNFYTKTAEFDSFVKKVIVGSHGNFYRVVIYFDANYKYKITDEPEGVKIELR